MNYKISKRPKAPIVTLWSKEPHPVRTSTHKCCSLQIEYIIRFKSKSEKWERWSECHSRTESPPYPTTALLFFYAMSFILCHFVFFIQITKSVPYIKKSLRLWTTLLQCCLLPTVDYLPCRKYKIKSSDYSAFVTHNIYRTDICMYISREVKQNGVWKVREHER